MSEATRQHRSGICNAGARKKDKIPRHHSGVLQTMGSVKKKRNINCTWVCSWWCQRICQFSNFQLKATLQTEKFHATYIYPILNVHSSVINKKLFVVSIKYNGSFVEQKTKQNKTKPQTQPTCRLCCCDFSLFFIWEKFHKNSYMEYQEITPCLQDCCPKSMELNLFKEI